MKTMLALLILLPVSASAMNRYDARQYTCAQLKQIVKNEKIVLLESTFFGGRFARSKYDCSPADKAVSNAYLRASDTLACNPGILCRVKFRDE